MVGGDYRAIAQSMSRDYTSSQFLVDTAVRLAETTVHTTGGGARYDYLPVGDTIPCRVTRGETVEANLEGRQVTVLRVHIIMPPGTFIGQNDRIQVTNSTTGETRTYEVLGIEMTTFEVMRKVAAVQVT